MKNTTKQWLLLGAIFLGPLAFLLLAYLVLLTFNEHILKSEYPPDLYSWTELIAAPDDLFDLLVDEEMEAADAELEWRATVEVKHKYRGPHMIRLRSSDRRFFRPKSARYQTKCWSEENLILYQGEVDFGGALNWYDIPDDFEQEEVVTCEITVTEENKGAGLPPPRIRIGRGSRM